MSGRRMGAMLFHFLVSLVCLGQEEGNVPPTPYDRVFEFELTEDDPELIDSGGLTVVVEYDVEFSGTLHLWTRSELDLYLRVEDVMDSSILAEDDNSGGGGTPYAELRVEEGDYLAILIAGAMGGELGPLELHAVASPETEATLEVATTVQERAAEIRGLQESGDTDSARETMRALVEAIRATPGVEHSHRVSSILTGLGFLAEELGDLESTHGVRSLLRAARERTLPSEHPDLFGARMNLANSMYEMGDLPGARALEESVLAAHERTLPEGHSDLLHVRMNLASTMRQMGDLPGARALNESVLVARERTLPEGHPDLLRARFSMANTMEAMGDLAGARALKESVLAGYERALPEGHPDLLAARMNLAVTMKAVGDLPGARALEESVLADYERALPEGHPHVLRAWSNLAITMGAMGDLPGARALEESVLAGYERTLTKDHPNLLRARLNLADTMYAMGDLLGARALLPAQTSGMRERVLTSLTLAPRQAREAVGAEADRLAGVLLLSRSGGPKLQRPVFELQETMRMVAGEAARALGASEDPEVAALMEKAGSIRASLNNLALGSKDENSGDLSSKLTQLMQERDRLEREASKRLAERGVVMQPIEVDRLVKGMEERAALVTYRRIDHGNGEGEHLLAHALTGDGSLTRIDLGEATELEDLVEVWRAALGAPLMRGVTLEEGEDDSEVVAGEALRARLFDPILSELGDETRRLYVCADDLVFLVPLDALPHEEGRVGDRWSVANEVSCARLISSSASTQAEPGLLALGGVDYEADPATETDQADPATSRSRLPDRFSQLLQTRIEAETTGLLFEDLLEVEPVVLTRKETTKAALFEHAPGKRFLHLATHGWFASEAIKSTLDEEPGGGDWSRMGLQERVTGMAPMLLCGLALAGANNPPDSLARRPGILTAEELCSLDLSACDLAVLSACETNVGIRRAGQGIQSLQAALYAAGARSSITSLWKVDDAATRRLMELFYTKLWEEKQPTGQALWEAKMVLRDEGAQVRDWAGWVLTGNPD